MVLDGLSIDAEQEITGSIGNCGLGFQKWFLSLEWIQGVRGW